MIRGQRTKRRKQQGTYSTIAVRWSLTRRARQVALACLATAATTVTLGINNGANASSSSPSQLLTITIPSQGLIAPKWLGYSGPPRANVLLPAGYNPSQHYPLLVLLNGLGENYDSYAQYGLTSLFAGLDAIVVMPEGANGWYTDWWNNGERDGPAWESYELDVVLPYVLAHYPILPQRQYHAIAGFSMGGLGATYLGGRLPGFFGSVATLSGFVDLNYLGPLAEGGMGLFSEGEVAYLSSALSNGDPRFPYPVDGTPGSFYFDGHNPASLVMNLEQTRVFESTGTGIPNSADLGTLTNPESAINDDLLFAALEGPIIYPMSQLYHQALVTAGVDVTYQVHSGLHYVPDEATEIKAMLAWGLFKPVVTDPNSWVNDTVATSGQLWDISYHFDLPPNQVVSFRQSGNLLSIGAAGSDVTLTTSGGCVIHTTTPTTIQIPSDACNSLG
jgi:S-formylglutathione hydrolase FrmB